MFGIAISGAFKEIEGTLSLIPTEPPAAAAADSDAEPAPDPPGPPSASASASASDELAARRARRRAG